jgi:hypothetical protein
VKLGCSLTNCRLTDIGKSMKNNQKSVQVKQEYSDRTQKVRSRYTYSRARQGARVECRVFLKTLKEGVTQFCVCVCVCVCKKV